MASFLPGFSGRHQVRSHPLLEELVGQSIIHTRVASRGTWTVTARGWVLHSRIQQLAGATLGSDEGGVVGLRDPHLLGGVITSAEILGDGSLSLTLSAPAGPLRLTSPPRWRLQGPRRAQLEAEKKGQVDARPAGEAVYATPETLALYAASRPSALEERLRETGRDAWIHPGHVVDLLARSGALEDTEFERRGPDLLGRLLGRGEIRAGFVSGGRFTPWDLPLAEVVEHIGTTWDAIGGRTPGPGMIAWFELTDAGRDALGPTSLQAMPPGMSGYDSPGVVGGFR
ncbi:hypothetical protein BH708_15170 [Brachybacterium sp. P6-10-X1]|uniref:hypothetical protein n=1 Tax=Brachybacterium sp. P6-10-X1 TaxID=1903186 RepID=UPI000971B061|nr:hypothetical protein [Brachybacterium sp. P6-10-X1]APX33828.1 hypothetical protein BH708_15170 [Brachybacterium sp. P6-10-X1]